MGNARTPTRGVLFDLSGVLYVGAAPLPGAVAALRELRDAQLPVRFVTNVSRTHSATILERLRGMGFAISREELYTAPLAAKAYLRSRGLRPHLLVHRDILGEFEGLSTDDPDAVLVGDAGEDFTYANLNRAFRMIVAGAPLFALGSNRYFQDDDGLSLDIGPFVTALEYAAGTTAVVLGKPASAFFMAPLETIGCAPGETVMVGDDVEADVNGAVAAGLRALLVRTGKYRRGDEDRLDTSRARVVAHVAEAVRSILENHA